MRRFFCCAAEALLFLLPAAGLAGCASQEPQPAPYVQPVQGRYARDAAPNYGAQQGARPGYRQGAAPGAGQGARHQEILYGVVDADRDGRVTRAEFDAFHNREFQMRDADGDGALSKSEFTAPPQKFRRTGARPASGGQGGYAPQPGYAGQAGQTGYDGQAAPDYGGSSGQTPYDAPYYDATTGQ